MKIVIEGMDGVGKSTIAKKLSDILGYSYFCNPLVSLFCYDKSGIDLFLKSLDSTIFNSQNSPLLKAWCTALGNIYCMQNTKDNTIIDRFVGSNYVWNFSPDTEKVFDLLDNVINKPDITFVLYASPDERKKRISGRKHDDSDLNDEDIFKDLYPMLLECLDRYKYKYFLIDTSQKSIDEIIEEIITILNGGYL